ncbi:hypothetical protein M9Y10_026477 [Tritrichomonas musculus]|uniref:Protein kinase domain-containing protein n=1 Tax=Tritrichomonas musculus TaxID=1915356 RepID=A0ABR2H7P4_9EUKA
MDITQKTIALYGLACALKYFQENHIVPSNLNRLDKILLDDDFYPQICGFYFSDIEFTKDNFIVPPEIIGKQELDKKSYPYFFGAISYLIMSNIVYPDGVNRNPEIPDDFPSAFKSTIKKCLGSKGGRPTIDQIIAKFDGEEPFIFPDVDMSKFKEYQDYVINHRHPKVIADRISGFASNDPLSSKEDTDDRFSNVNPKFTKSSNDTDFEAVSKELANTPAYKVTVIHKDSQNIDLNIDVNLPLLIEDAKKREPRVDAHIWHHFI